MSYLSDKEKFIGCDIELINDDGTFRGPIKNIREENGRMIFETFWIASLNYLKGWTITAEFNNTISFVISRAGAVGSCDGGKTREIHIAELSGRIYLLSKDLGQLNPRDIHGFDCSDVCWNCGKVNLEELRFCECQAPLGEVLNRITVTSVRIPAKMGLPVEFFDAFFDQNNKRIKCEKV